MAKSGNKKNSAKQRSGKAGGKFLDTSIARGNGGKGKTGLKMPKSIQKRIASESKDVKLGITRSSIRRLARRGGIKRISTSIYDEARKEIYADAENILKKAITYTEHARRKTISKPDIQHALSIKNRPIYI